MSCKMVIDISIRSGMLRLGLSESEVNKLASVLVLFLHMYCCESGRSITVPGRRINSEPGYLKKK